MFDKSENPLNRDKSLDFLHFQWCDNNYEIMYLSSGEEAMLSLMARIYYGVESVNKEFDSKNNFLVLEEPELYLHPNWQRRLISIIINFIDKMIENNVQIIFSSNTPFLISDLPKKNIIFMEKDKKYNLCKISEGLNYQIQTFGQNIHTLLRESFFMSERTQGEFAKTKIKTLINEIKKIRDSGEKIDYVKNGRLIRAINIIGEPLVKHILLGMMYDLKIENEAVFTIDDEIEYYEKQIKYLKRIKKYKDNLGELND